MAKKSKIQVISINYEKEDGSRHEAIIPQKEKSKSKTLNAAAPPYGMCSKVGEEKCHNGSKYICINVFGTPIWSKSLSEKCDE